MACETGVEAVQEGSVDDAYEELRLPGYGDGDAEEWEGVGEVLRRERVRIVVL